MADPLDLKTTFATRHINTGWVIDATKADGQVEELVGVYAHEHDAVNWIANQIAWTKLKLVSGTAAP
jgi:hypothetical protein